MIDYCWRDRCGFPAWFDGDLIEVFVDVDGPVEVVERVCVVHAPWKRWAAGLPRLNR